MPSLSAPDIGRIVFAVDTSGSVNQSQLDIFSKAITEILELFKQSIEATIIYADSRVYEDKVQHVTAMDLPVKLKFYGGGGTSFTPVIKYINKHIINPVGIIWFTDTFAWDHVTEPCPCPVLFVVPQQSPTYIIKTHRNEHLGDLIHLPFWKESYR